MTGNGGPQGPPFSFVGTGFSKYCGEGERVQNGASWIAYWRGRDVAPTGAAASPEIRAFWRACFGDAFSRRGPLRILDMACGDGVLARLAADVAGSGRSAERISYFSSDLSFHALSAHPGGLRIVADASAIPFKPQSFDLVVSQFGIEYAGADAILAAAEQVRPGGQLALVLHLADGLVAAYSRACLHALERVQDSGILKQARQAFDLEHTGATVDIRSRAGLLWAEVEALGQQARDAQLFIGRMLGDLTALSERADAYPPDEARRWIDHQSGEVEAYRARMASMLRAALSADDIAELSERLRALEFTVASPTQAMLRHGDRPGAWLWQVNRL